MSLKHYEAGSEFPKLGKEKLRLYSMKYCPYAERARLVLAAKQIPYETINVNLVKKPDWFLARTPAGLVPVLEHDDGRILYESLVVSEYLDTVYPEHRLIPTDPFEKAKHQILIETLSKVTSSFYKVLRKAEGAENDLNKALDYFENALNGSYFGGDKEAMVDYMIWPWFSRLYLLAEFANVNLDTNRFPKLMQWIERMKQLPAVKETYISPEEMNTFYKGYLSGNPIYDLNTETKSSL